MNPKSPKPRRANPDLPPEILIEIFSRLPTKAVGACRCLSKPWNTYLCTKNFIKFHLSRQQHQQNIILINYDNYLYVVTAPIKGNSVSKKLNMVTNKQEDNWRPRGLGKIIGSCNGLVLYKIISTDWMCVMNPITQHSLKIPDLAKEVMDFDVLQTLLHGFGYDNCSDDYKIVELCYYRDIFIRYGRRNYTLAYVYSMKKCLWKVLDISYFYRNTWTPSGHVGTFVNGAIHWMVSTKELLYRPVIAAFSLATEVFVEIPAPKNISRGNLLSNGIFILRGCLCMVDEDEDNIKPMIDFWILKEYHVRDSWTKFSVHRSQRDVTISPLCYLDDENVVVSFTENYYLLVSNLEDGTTKNMIVDGIPVDDLYGGCVFVDSLVSPMEIRVLKPMLSPVGKNR